MNEVQMLRMMIRHHYTALGIVVGATFFQVWLAAIFDTYWPFAFAAFHIWQALCSAERIKMIKHQVELLDREK